MTSTVPTGSTTLAEIVNTVAGSARVLESFGLDYCCGGSRPLTIACAAEGIEPDTVLDALSAVADAPLEDWAAMGPAALVDHLEATHHGYLHTELGRLSELAEKVATVHGDRHPELVAVRDAYEALRADLEPHLLKEERVLFPMIRELATAPEPPTLHCGPLTNPISVMLVEHDRAGALLATLRRLTDDYETPADGCASYRALYDGLALLEADTHLHIHKENNLLFPTVVALEKL